MSLWSKFTSFVAKVLGAEQAPPEKPVPVRLRPSTPRVFERPGKAKVERGTPRHERYRDVWDKVYDDFDRSLPDTAIGEFNERESRFRALFDVWSDPSESDNVQLAAYEEFWDDMADFGYSVSDFDWADFKQKYESLSG